MTWYGACFSLRAGFEDLEISDSVLLVVSMAIGDGGFFVASKQCIGKEAAGGSQKDTRSSIRILIRAFIGYAALWRLENEDSCDAFPWK